MLNISSIYPRHDGYWFDFDYYLNIHMPRSIDLLSSTKGFKSVSVERGIDVETLGLTSPFVAMCHIYFETLDDFMSAFMPHSEELQGDIPNYTDISPTIQINNIEITKS